jgi:hypothetical protein
MYEPKKIKMTNNLEQRSISLNLLTYMFTYSFFIKKCLHVGTQVYVEELQLVTHNLQ